MQSLKRLYLVLFFILVCFCSIVVAQFGETNPVGVSTCGDDYQISSFGVPSNPNVPEYMSVPHLSSKAQRVEHHAIKLYSNDWWVAVYGSLNGVNIQMISLSTFMILSGLFLCTMGFRLLRPSLGVIGYLTFGLILWAALANLKSPNGYPNDSVVMITVPMCVGLVGAAAYYMYTRYSLYFSGALGGLALALFICSWKSDLVIENTVGRLGFMVGLAIVSGAAGRFLPRDSPLFTTSFVGAYVIMLGVDCVARKGYIAAFESLINFNPNSQVEYALSPFVYAFLALTLILFFMAYGWQYYFNFILPGILIANKKKKEAKMIAKREQAMMEAQRKADYEEWVAQCRAQQGQQGQGQQVQGQ